MREGFPVARCKIERLMRSMVFTRRCTRESQANDDPPKNNRDPSTFVHHVYYATRPNQLWAAYFTYVVT